MVHFRKSKETLTQQRKLVYDKLNHLHGKVLELKKKSHVSQFSNQCMKLASVIVDESKNLRPQMQIFMEELHQQYYEAFTTIAMARYYQLSQKLLEDLMQCMSQSPKPIQKILKKCQDFVENLENDVLWLNEERLSEPNKPRWSVY